MASEEEVSIASIDLKHLSTLRVVDLKAELDKRGLSKSGSKKDLMERLKVQMQLEGLQKEAAATTTSEVKVPNLGLQDDAVAGQNEFVKQYLAEQQKAFEQQAVARKSLETEDSSTQEVESQSEDDTSSRTTRSRRSTESRSSDAHDKEEDSTEHKRRSPRKSKTATIVEKTRKKKNEAESDGEGETTTKKLDQKSEGKDVILENDKGHDSNEKHTEQVEELKSSSGKLEAVSDEGIVEGKGEGSEGGDKGKKQSENVDSNREDQDNAEVGKAKEVRKRRWDSRGRSESRENGETRSKDNKIKLKRGTLNQGLNQVGEQCESRQVDDADKKPDADEGIPSDKTNNSDKEPNATNSDDGGRKVESSSKESELSNDAPEQEESKLESKETSAAEKADKDDNEKKKSSGELKLPSKPEPDEIDDDKTVKADDDVETKSIQKTTKTARESRSKTRKTQKKKNRSSSNSSSSSSSSRKSGKRSKSRSSSSSSSGSRSSSSSSQSSSSSSSDQSGRSSSPDRDKSRKSRKRASEKSAVDKDDKASPEVDKKRKKKNSVATEKVSKEEVTPESKPKTVDSSPESSENKVDDKEPAADREVENKNEDKITAKDSKDDEKMEVDHEEQPRGDGQTKGSLADKTESKSSPRKSLTDRNSSKPATQRKRRWGSSKLTKSTAISISTQSLKGILPDVKPTPLKLLEEEPPLAKDDANVENKPPTKVSRPITQTVTDESENKSPSPEPPQNPPSCVLQVLNLVRPFTVNQLKDMLSKEGKIASENGFWIDKIKSKCLVKYESVKDATRTRDSINNTTWPASNPKKLSVDFSTERHLSSLLEPSSPVRPTVQQEKEKKREKRQSREILPPVREWDRHKLTQSPDKIDGKRSRSRRSSSRDRKGIEKVSKEEEAPAKLLDDLFRKTKTTPCIYWLPLTDEQIKQRLEDRKKREAEREKRRELRHLEMEKTRKAQQERRVNNTKWKRTRSRSPVHRRR